MKRGNGYKDLTGKKFGRLIVIADTGNRHQKNVIWECKCECGNTKEVKSIYLLKGWTKSCGCLNIEKIKERRLIKENGNKYGKLTVKEIVGRNDRGRVIWSCECECGKLTNAIGDDLRSGHKRSCGCSRSGSNSYLWRGGISKEPYPVQWVGTLKESIRRRFCYSCAICGKRQGKTKLSIHHIDYDKKNINPINLIALCRSCHIKTNHNREYWQHRINNGILVY